MDAFAERPVWPSETGPLQDALRVWIGEHHQPSMTVREWWRLLANAGLTAPTWPRANGGLGSTTKVQERVEEELAAAGCVAPPVDNDGFRAVAPALRHFVPLDRLARHLQPILEGRHRWALLDEDVDGSETGIERDWKYHTLSGRKVDADPLATHGIVVIRTDKNSTGAKGLTCFLVDLREEPITRADGVVVIDGCKVLHDAVIGTEHNGREIVAFVKPYLERSLAGRIRRGLVNVPAGELAGTLDLTLAEAAATYQPPPPPDTDRRQRA